MLWGGRGDGHVAGCGIAGAGALPLLAARDLAHARLLSDVAVVWSGGS